VILPLKILYPYQRRHVAVLGLAFANFAVFLWTCFEPEVVRDLALDPRDFAPHQLLTSMFVHVGSVHLIGNMLFLCVYGTYASHLGGFAAGCLLAVLLRRPAMRGSGWYLEPQEAFEAQAMTVRLRAARARSREAAQAAPVGAGGAEVVLRSIGTATSRVAVIKLLMRHAGMDPEEANERLGGLDAETPVVVAFGTDEAADRFFQEAELLGLVVERPPAPAVAPRAVFPPAAAPPPRRPPPDPAPEIPW